MKSYKEEFVRFLVDCDALKFGEFTLKSGRVAPYFINTGMYNDGERIALLGEYYARAILEHFPDVQAVYGPAYKGIPICVAASIALSRNGRRVGYVFNRKQRKGYGQKDALVGFLAGSSTKIVLVDDVITSGAAVRESLAVLSEHAGAKVAGIVVSVDRQEKGSKSTSALEELSEELKVPVRAIVNWNDLEGNLCRPGGPIEDQMMERIREYRKIYGA